MAQAFEYRVCQMQSGRITFVNGQWQGRVDYHNADQTIAMNSCPEIWDYLQQCGPEGWELVTVANTVVTHGTEVSQITNQLFLKRQLA